MSVKGLHENAVLNTLALDDNRLVDKRVTYIFSIFSASYEFRGPQIARAFSVSFLEQKGILTPTRLRLFAVVFFVLVT